MALVSSLVSSLVMAADTAPPKLPDELALGEDAVVLAFGDSLTFGIGSPALDYPEMLAARIGRRVVNAGLPGDTTGYGRRRLAEALLSVDPDLLILCLGSNDFINGVARVQIRANLLAMIARQPMMANTMIVTMTRPVN